MFSFRKDMTYDMILRYKKKNDVEIGSTNILRLHEFFFGDIHINDTLLSEQILDSKRGRYSTNSMSNIFLLTEV